MSTYCSICFCDFFDEFVVVQKLLNDKFDYYKCTGELKSPMQTILIYEAVITSILLGTLFYKYFWKNKMKTS